MKQFPTKGREKAAIFLVLAANIIVRFIWIGLMHPVQEADFQWYYDHAVELANNQGYNWFGQPTAYWPIGWPLFLSLIFRITGPSVIVGLVVNAILSTVIVWMIYVLTRRLFQNHAYALAASIAYTLLPSQIVWNSVLGSEELFTTLLLISLYLYVRAERFRALSFGVAIAGIVLGFAVDVRPIPLAFPLFVFLYEVMSGQSGTLKARFWPAIARAVTLFVGMLISVLPVTIRNRITMHHWVLVSTNGGTNLFQGIHTNGGYWWSYNPYVNPLLNIHNEVQKNAVGEHAALHYIEHHIGRTIVNGFIKIWDLYKDDLNANWYTFRVSPHVAGWLRPMDAVLTTAYFLFMVPAGIGLIYFWVRRIPGWRQAWLPFAFLLYNTCFFFFFPAWDRFRYPLMPLFAIFAGVGLVSIFREMKSDSLHRE
ncbi:hypothetical protein Heshes_11660 [Alicyclobacillus hesperidum]|uniref:Dolichyl-phosphate-mannose-protein mannosyltransferase n=1 Tax=Alicyclobacillus hesperidum TaxID=89784 RepID=A0A1H2RUQ5_9BACL|nr:glycosyltransferase family 39 protein [Alicyclobacillus hesperidum]GLV13482.1 hypothetical protein Heshes_11660 [Alicyclobacillus hesperidum]SDW22359.1 Dolichyl-phosphate-mannose-protein mannosyltransferase [Alicyclobacillus hesperidum]